jgi:hypothetical protein
VVIQYYSAKLWDKLGFMGGDGQQHKQYSGVPVEPHKMMLLDRHRRDLVAAAREVLKESQDERERERA